MAVSLKKGEKISLTKTNPGLKKVIVGLGWDAAARKRGLFGMFANAQSIDCDASAFLLKGGRLSGFPDIVYYGNLNHASQSVIHQGDNLTGDGDGDDEQIFVDLTSVPSEFDKIVIVANIYKAKERMQHFGMIQNAFIRIVDAANNSEMCRFSLSDDYSGMTAMIFGELYRNEGEWKFSATGQGTKDPGLSELCQRFMN